MRIRPYSFATNFRIPSTPFSRFSMLVAKEIRTYPSPYFPKEMPGSTATPFS